jgi:hypothetical protein
MRLKSLLRSRVCLPLAGAGLVATLLAGRHGTSSDPPDQGVVWVYYTSLCAEPGDNRACSEIRQPIRQAFDRLEACDAYRTRDLDRAGNPRLLGSCLRLHEA